MPLSYEASLADLPPRLAAGYEKVGTRFEPIGWSKNGDLAYVSEVYVDGCACTATQVAVQNLRTDDLLSMEAYIDDPEFVDDPHFVDDPDPKFESESEDGMTEEEIDKKAQKRQTRRENRVKEWKAAQLAGVLGKYGITPEPMAMYRFPLMRGDDQLSVSVDAKENTKAKFHDEAYRISVFLTSKKLGRKRIGRWNGTALFIEADAIGYLVNPRDPGRIAVLIRQGDREHASSTATLQINVLGASLNGGFKP